jgi:hypothetical protein
MINEAAELDCMFWMRMIDLTNNFFFFFTFLKTDNFVILKSLSAMASTLGWVDF